MVRNTRLSFFFFFFFFGFLLFNPRGAGVDYARIASELRFRFGHKSFYRFGIRSCLATSHKQIIKTRNARHRAFWVSRQHRQRLFIHPLFIVSWRIAKYF